jgi:hypothetical protein
MSFTRIVYLDDILHANFEPEDLEFLLGTREFSIALSGTLRGAPCARSYAELCALGTRLLSERFGAARLEPTELLTSFPE